MKKIFLTGASSGIGLATAQALVNAGHEVWGTSRDPARIPNVPHLHGIRMDLAEVSSVEEAFANALVEAGSFDVLINNAGGGHFGPAEFFSNDVVINEFKVLVFSHIRLMQLALEKMHGQGHGLIINVTSLASRLPIPFMGAYNAAKAAMAAWTMSIQLELGQSRIRVVDLQPADICTGFNDAVGKIPSREPRYQEKLAKTWAATDRNMRAAPRPELVAHHIVRMIEQASPSPRVTVGGFFQAKVAPLIFRFLPQRLRIWGLKNYYGI